MERVLEPEVMDTWEEAMAYEAMDHEGPNAAFVARCLELGITRGEVADLGCGPGHIPVLLAGRAPGVRVRALDLAAHMLRLARRRVEEAGLAGRVLCVRADAKRLPLAGAGLDAVLSNTILHHLPDPLPFLAECRRVLRPGGALLIRDLCRPPSMEEARALVDLHAAGASPTQRRLLLDSLRASLTLEEMACMAARAGLGAARLWRSSDRHWTLEAARAHP